MTKSYTKRQIQIIHAAVELIATGGMSALTMNNIASKINVTEPALYRHFKSKKEILLGVIKLLRHSGQISKTNEKTGWELVESTMQGRIASFIEMPGLAAIIFSEEIFSGDNDLSLQIKAMMRETQERFIKVMHLAQQEGTIRSDLEAEQIALMVIGSFRFLVTQWHLFENNFDLAKRASALFTDLRKLLLLQ
ncbi:MAG: TetR/AcrR family transcriptional regulator [Candidatus Marinimicrobia bacterium]|nr:TetR/AcrR family transcriptional regulator [Candidatus Neomarinimicrobiota bacterium]